MIRPTKHLDLDTCILNVAAHALSILKGAGAMQYDGLLKMLQATLSKRIRFEFVLALDLLYLAGRIEYDEDTDAVVLVPTPEGRH